MRNSNKEVPCAARLNDKMVPYARVNDKMVPCAARANGDTCRARVCTTQIDFEILGVVNLDEEWRKYIRCGASKGFVLAPGFDPTQCLVSRLD